MIGGKGQNSTQLSDAEWAMASAFFIVGVRYFNELSVRLQRKLNYYVTLLLKERPLKRNSTYCTNISANNI